MARLRDSGFQRSALASAEELDAALNSTPLLLYAYHAWAIHGRESIHEDVAKSLLLDFVQGCQGFPILPRKYAKLDRFSPLHVAAFFDLPLSMAGPSHLQNPNTVSQEEGLTPLHLACMQNSQLAVKELLSLPRILVNAPDKSGSTALIWASWASDQGDEIIVELLLSHPQIKVNHASNSGTTALHHAAQPGCTGTAKVLLSHPKIKVNRPNSDGMTPFMTACTSMNTETVKLFLAHRKLDVNAVDRHGSTALIWMMFRADTIHIDMAKALLAHPKVNVNRRDKAGKTAYDWACRRQLGDLIDLLVAHPKIRR
ncbi:ankyrin repeat-containing domain protein [Coprinopsis sp. MPI-PUGE-AT-0042]|nr:ankyrin repeat-containing domain protein [Coprinopsis sp. MPI-PUGE-AT-0042]